MLRYPSGISQYLNFSTTYGSSSTTTGTGSGSGSGSGSGYSITGSGSGLIYIAASTF